MGGLQRNSQHSNGTLTPALCESQWIKTLSSFPRMCFFASAQEHWGQPPPTSIAGRNGFVKKKKKERERQRVAYVGWEEIVKRWE